MSRGCGTPCCSAMSTGDARPGRRHPCISSRARLQRLEMLSVWTRDRSRLSACLTLDLQVSGRAPHPQPHHQSHRVSSGRRAPGMTRANGPNGAEILTRDRTATVRSNGPGQHGCSGQGGIWPIFQSGGLAGLPPPCAESWLCTCSSVSVSGCSTIARQSDTGKAHISAGCVSERHAAAQHVRLLQCLVVDIEDNFRHRHLIAVQKGSFQGDTHSACVLLE